MINRLISKRTWGSLPAEMKGRITDEYAADGRRRFIGAKTLILNDKVLNDGIKTNRMLVEGLDFVIEGHDPDSLI